MHRLHRMNLVATVDSDEKRDKLIKKGWKWLNPPAEEKPDAPETPEPEKEKEPEPEKADEKPSKAKK